MSDVWIILGGIAMLAPGLALALPAYAVGRRFGWALGLLAAVEAGLLCIGVIALVSLVAVWRRPELAQDVYKAMLALMASGVVLLGWTPMALVAAALGAWRRRPDRLAARGAGRHLPDAQHRLVPAGRRRR